RAADRPRRERPASGAAARARRRRLAVGAAAVVRGELTIDLGAVRRNARRLLDALCGAELWAVVKANGYGHGATDCARAALEAGATALCVATVPEALALRRELPHARILVMGPAAELSEAREARLELLVSGPPPEGVPVHVK